MADDAIASVVLQKLSDLQVDESFASNTTIGHRLKRMKETLESSSSAEAAEEETKGEEIKKQREEYLGHLYSIEDSIDSFALRFTRQRKKLGCFMNHTLFLKNFTALKLLDIKLCNIQTKVKKLNSRTNSEGSNSRGSSLLQQPEPDEQVD